jgi:hypothetical protein
MAGVAFVVEGDGVGFATATSALYTTLANLSGALWRIRRASLLRKRRFKLDHYPNLALRFKGSFAVPEYRPLCENQDLCTGFPTAQKWAFLSCINHVHNDLICCCRPGTPSVLAATAPGGRCGWERAGALSRACRQYAKSA